LFEIDAGAQFDSLHYNSELQYLLIVLATRTTPKELENWGPEVGTAEIISHNVDIYGVIVAMATAAGESSC
jgi:hypothetical protein